MTAKQGTYVREILTVTRQMLAKAEELCHAEIDKADQDPQVLAELAELMAARQKLIGQLDALGFSGFSNVPGNREEVQPVLTEIVDLNTRLGQLLEAHREKLAGLVARLREGKQLLSYLRHFTPGTGTIVDQRE